MTFDKIAKIIAESKDLDAAEIKTESTFEELGLDSLDTVELIMAFEEEFGIELEPTDDMTCVADLVALVDSMVS